MPCPAVRCPLAAPVRCLDTPRQHTPGFCRYHPHQHGSTTVQVPTANGLIIIEGGPEWMPDSK